MFDTYSANWERNNLLDGELTWKTGGCLAASSPVLFKSWQVSRRTWGPLWRSPAHSHCHRPLHPQPAQNTWKQSSEHPNSFHLYQDLLCIKLVGFCVNQEERCPICVNHLLNLIEALNYQRVHARHFGKNWPDRKTNVPRVIDFIHAIKYNMGQCNGRRVQCSVCTNCINKLANCSDKT